MWQRYCSPVGTPYPCYHRPDAHACSYSWGPRRCTLHGAVDCTQPPAGLSHSRFRLVLLSHPFIHLFIHSSIYSGHTYVHLLFDWTPLSLSACLFRLSLPPVSSTCLFDHGRPNLFNGAVFAVQFIHLVHAYRPNSHGSRGPQYNRQ